MAQKPENVFNLLEDLLSYSIPVAKQEADEFQEMLSKTMKVPHSKHGTCIIMPKST